MTPAATATGPVDWERPDWGDHIYHGTTVDDGTHNDTATQEDS